MTPRLNARTKRLEQPADLGGLVAQKPDIAWLTSGISLVAFGECVRVDPGTGQERFRGAAEEVETLLAGAAVEDEVDLPGSGPIAFGSWTFDPEVAGSAVVVPSTVYGVGEDGAWKTEIEWEEGNEALTAVRLGRGSSTQHEQRGSDVWEAAYPAGPESPLSQREWMGRVETALERIRAGRLQKVVLAREVVLRSVRPLNPFEVLARLARQYPGCFNFWFDGLVGASPELLVRRLGDVVDSIPLAGSAPRGASEHEDAELGRRLRASPKDRAEHALTVETVMESLTPYCSHLVAEQEPSLLLLANMQHLSTKVQGRLSDAASALELVAALHPTAAVCGVPEGAALELIREIEGLDRGRYAGPIGWMDHKGDGEWAVALRCAEVKAQTARVFAGAGIVAGSDPALELEETDLKLNAMLSALEAKSPPARSSLPA
ncbi:MAG: isochorismate synthase [Actinomycetota bacterium]|nr:isochorismate synthase [Actinomycetota bacterium]